MLTCPDRSVTGSLMPEDAVVPLSRPTNRPCRCPTNPFPCLTVPLHGADSSHPSPDHPHIFRLRSLVSQAGRPRDVDFTTQSPWHLHPASATMKKYTPKRTARHDRRRKSCDRSPRQAGTERKLGTSRRCSRRNVAGHDEMLPSISTPRNGFTSARDVAARSMIHDSDDSDDGDESHLDFCLTFLCSWETIRTFYILSRCRTVPNLILHHRRLGIQDSGFLGAAVDLGRSKRWRHRRRDGSCPMFG